MVSLFISKTNFTERKLGPSLGEPDYCLELADRDGDRVVALFVLAALCRGPEGDVAVLQKLGSFGGEARAADSAAESDILCEDVWVDFRRVLVNFLLHVDVKDV